MATEDDIDYQDGVHLTSCGGSLACDPRRRLHRFLILFFLSFLAFGSYFSYDIPAALQDVMFKELKIDNTQFMNLYAFYSWPNVIVCFINGFLVDRVFGLRLGGIIFSGIVMIAQLIFSVGVGVNNLPLMYIGRLLLGIGAETLATVQNAYCISWFPPSEVTLVFGLQMSIARIGSTVTMNVMAPLYSSMAKTFHVEGPKQLGFAVSVGVIFCAFSFLCSCFMAYFDRRAKKILEEGRKTSLLVNNVSELDLTLSHDELLTADNEPSTSGAQQEQDKITIKSILHFPAEFWLISLSIVCFYVTIFTFVGMAKLFFINKYALEPSQAAFINSLVYIVSAVASPVMGSVIDLTGFNVVWVLLSICTVLFVHSCFTFTMVIPPMFLMIVLGVGYSTYASIWPLIGLVIKENQLGTAYGICQSIQNLGLALIAQAVGAIIDAKGYFITGIFFMIWLYLALAITIVLFMVDRKHGSLLNKSGKQRRLEADQEVARNKIEVTPTVIADDE